MTTLIAGDCIECPGYKSGYSEPGEKFESRIKVETLHEDELIKNLNKK